MYISPNNTASKYTKQKLIDLNEEIDKYTIIVEDFNTPLRYTYTHKVIHNKIRKIFMTTTAFISKTGHMIPSSLFFRDSPEKSCSVVTVCFWVVLSYCAEPLNQA